MRPSTRIPDPSRRTRRTHRRSRPAALLAVLVTVASLLGATPAHADASDDRCASVDVIGVRGSAEAAGTGTGSSPNVYAPGTGGLGLQLLGVTQSLQSTPGLDVHVEALRYPASLWPGSGANQVDYFSSLRQGVAALRDEIEDVAFTCPGTTIQLVGFSQGAHVIGDVLAGSALSQPARARIDGAAFFGDPTYRPGEAWDAPGNGTGRGIFERGPGAFTAWTRTSAATGGPVPLVRSWCVANDFYCQRGFSRTVHHTYRNAQTQEQAAAFLRDLLAARDR